MLLAVWQLSAQGTQEAFGSADLVDAVLPWAGASAVPAGVNDSCACMMHNK